MRAHQLAAAFLLLPAWLWGAEPCQNVTLRIAVENLGPERRSGYIGGSSAAAFSLAPSQTGEVTLYLHQPTAEQRLTALIPEETQCAGFVEMPSSCPPDGIAARLYLYKGSDGYRCFIRSVNHLPRPQQNG